ncbi:MAG: Amino acid/amide transporter substrate-binding protein family [Streptosporangiaceae bacterium]|nr:Amino acid/amide transporter substrate-binding protein family [Streptosporangiaceae bacterium]
MTGPGSARRLRVAACLSLSGRHARFGGQAALGLRVWRSLEDSAELVVADDRSDPRRLEQAMRRLRVDADVVLGPYSTQLMRGAGRSAAEAGGLVWNHGGSGDDVQAAYPGHVISVPTPAGRYAEPFLRLLAREPVRVPLLIAEGRGRFGRQVAAGADAAACGLGLETVRLGPGDRPRPAEPPGHWDLLCAGSFEEDVATVRHARGLRRPPRTVCAVAAGVSEFGRAVADPEGVFGVGQWTTGTGHGAELGPAEEDFLAAYAERTGGGVPDYPAVQAAAAAVLAVHCASLAKGSARELLWPVATALDTSTLFGRFKVDPGDGAQLAHLAVLTRWTSGRPICA